VTEAFEYDQCPHLAEFFCQYSRAPDDMHGKDGTVSMPTYAEECTTRCTLGLTYKPDVPLHKLAVIPLDKDPLYFITPPPILALYAPPGHATCGFKAYDIATSQVVFLKDSWRIVLPGIKLEGLVYTKLNSANVCWTLNCLAWGDILDLYHITQTQNFTQAKWACYFERCFEQLSKQASIPLSSTYSSCPKCHRVYPSRVSILF